MKKLCIGILALTLAGGLSACTAYEDTLPVPESYQTAVRPADGWSGETLAPLIYVNGQQLEYPCSLQTFGSKYSYSKYFTEYNPMYDHISTSLTRLDKYVAYVSFDSITDADELTMDTPIASISFWEEDLGENFVFNGLTFDSTPDDIREALGEPDYENRSDTFSVYQYEHKNGGGLISITADSETNTIQSISLFFNGSGTWSALDKNENTDTE